MGCYMVALLLPTAVVEWEQSWTSATVAATVVETIAAGIAVNCPNTVVEDDAAALRVRYTPCGTWEPLRDQVIVVTLCPTIFDWSSNTEPYIWQDKHQFYYTVCKCTNNIREANEWLTMIGKSPTPRYCHGYHDKLRSWYTRGTRESALYQNS
jgi:hypothetical protein